MIKHVNEDQQARDVRKASLGFKSWKTKMSDKKYDLLKEVIIPEGFFEGLSLIKKTDTGYTFHSKLETKYIFRLDKDNNDTLIEVILCECDSVSNAHESIIDFSMGLMADEIPKGEEKNVQIGDITFIGYGEKVSAIIFARNNVMVVIQSVGDIDIDVQFFAKKLDVWLQASRV